VVLVLLVAVVAVVAISASRNESGVAEAESDARSVAPGSAVEPTEASSLVPSPTQTTPTQDPSAEPKAAPSRKRQASQQLKALRGADLADVELTGRWTAQLASKYVGIVDPLQVASNGSHTFYAPDILTEHLALREASNLGATVILLRSTDYGGSYEGRPLWVTFADGSFSTDRDVRQWCQARFPLLSGIVLENTCAPRRLEPPGGG
jgi:hypothetical protein